MIHFSDMSSPKSATSKVNDIKIEKKAASICLSAMNEEKDKKKYNNPIIIGVRIFDQPITILHSIIIDATYLFASSFSPSKITE